MGKFVGILAAIALGATVATGLAAPANPSVPRAASTAPPSPAGTAPIGWHVFFNGTGSPRHLAVDAARDRGLFTAYIAWSSDTRFFVTDSNGTMKGNVSIGPWVSNYGARITVDPTTGYAYLSADVGGVVKVDPSVPRILARWTYGPFQPRALSIRAGILYAIQDSNRGGPWPIAKIDAATGAYLGNVTAVPVGPAGDLLVDPAGRYVFVRNATLLRVNFTDGSISDFSYFASFTLSAAGQRHLRGGRRARRPPPRPAKSASPPHAPADLRELRQRDRSELDVPHNGNRWPGSPPRPVDAERPRDLRGRVRGPGRQPHSPDDGMGHGRSADGRHVLVRDGRHPAERRAHVALPHRDSPVQHDLERQPQPSEHRRRERELGIRIGSHLVLGREPDAHRRQCDPGHGDRHPRQRAFHELPDPILAGPHEQRDEHDGALLRLQPTGLDDLKPGPGRGPVCDEPDRPDRVAAPAARVDRGDAGCERKSGVELRAGGRAVRGIVHGVDRRSHPHAGPRAHGGRASRGRVRRACHARGRPGTVQPDDRARGRVEPAVHHHRGDPGRDVAEPPGGPGLDPGRVPDRDGAAPSPADVGNPDLGRRRRGGRRGCRRHWRRDLDSTAAEHTPEESARRRGGRAKPPHEARRAPPRTVRGAES